MTPAVPTQLIAIISDSSANAPVSRALSSYSPWPLGTAMPWATWCI